MPGGVPGGAGERGRAGTDGHSGVPFFCHARLPASRFCGEPPAALYDVGCVHEHINREWYCARHERMMLARVGGCAFCSEAGHEDCPIIGRLVERR